MLHVYEIHMQTGKKYGYTLPANNTYEYKRAFNWARAYGYTPEMQICKNGNARMVLVVHHEGDIFSDDYVF